MGKHIAPAVHHVELYFETWHRKLDSSFYIAFCPAPGAERHKERSIEYSAQQTSLQRERHLL